MRDKHRGITIIELLAVLVILGIIAAIAVPVVGQLIENTQRRTIEANITQLSSAVRLARVSEQFGEQAAAAPSSQALEDWEEYAIDILGDYVNEWPRPPFGGVFSFRYSENIRFEGDARNDNGPSFSRRLIRMVLDEEDEFDLEGSLIVYYDIDFGSEGHFIQMRFDEQEVFEETVRFLLESSNIPYIFQFHAGTDSIDELYNPSTFNSEDSNTFGHSRTFADGQFNIWIFIP